MFAQKKLKKTLDRIEAMSDLSDRREALLKSQMKQSPTADAKNLQAELKINKMNCEIKMRSLQTCVTQNQSQQTSFPREEKPYMNTYMAFLN